MELEKATVRQLTELDAARLRKLSAAIGDSELLRLVDEAEVVPGPEVGADVVTMYTQFEMEDEHGDRRMLAVCYPEDAEPSTGFVSVMSPLGSSVIGLAPGDEFEWRTPGGWSRGRIAAIVFQPEATGDYLT
jgi:regulator of nucleoside diphosphate kinase